MPVEERRFNDHSFGDETKQAETCKEIMARNSKLFIMLIFVVV